MASTFPTSSTMNGVVPLAVSIFIIAVPAVGPVGVAFITL
jgi:hypothetical protein